MKYFLSLLFLTLNASYASDLAAEESPEQQATQFFERYIGLYNQRFGNPGKSQWFRTEMAKLIHQPMLSAPLKSKPQVPESNSEYAKNLESFVKQLEKRGVTRLEYQQIEIHVLTPNKILANNVGHGLNDSGDVLYETISVYFLYRSDNRWQIAMLNAYDMDKALTLK